MLWSLLKVVAFLAIVAGLAVLAGTLSDRTDGLRLWVWNYEFTLGPLQAVIALLAVLVLLWLLLKLIDLAIASLRFLNGDETALSRYFDRNRERRGYEALSEGMIALAGGETTRALARAKTAERLLHKPELTGLLTAQAAAASGDTKTATEAWRALLNNEATRFVAVRGLLQQKLAEGDTATALKLAEQAFALKPRHAETQDVLLKLQAEGGDWKGARSTLAEKLRTGGLPRSVYRRRDALLALQEAKTILDEGATAEARDAAIEANRQSPDLIPAAVIAARAMIEKGDKRGATRILKKAWEAQPHPDLAASFAAIEPDEVPEARLKRFRTLLSVNPGHEESRLTEAELLLAAEDFPAARAALGSLPQTHPTQRALTILAAAERGSGAPDDQVRATLSRALTAPRGPEWVCDKCGMVHDDWVPVCGNCNGFDTLSWREVETDHRAPVRPDLAGLVLAPPQPPAVMIREIPSQPDPEPEPDPKPAPPKDVTPPLPPDEILRRAN